MIALGSLFGALAPPSQELLTWSELGGQVGED